MKKKEIWFKSYEFHPGDKYVGDYLKTRSDQDEESITVHWAGYGRTELRNYWAPLPKGICHLCGKPGDE